MKIGLVQTRGLGDIVIAAPIALYYIERGHEIYWPVDMEFISSVKSAYPEINFIPVDQIETGNSTADYFLHKPLSLLKEIGTEINIILYSHLSGFDLGYQKLSNSLPFDVYKYAVAGVPFENKWKYKPQRNIVRELELFNKLKIKSSDKYVVVHDQGSDFKANIIDRVDEREYRIIKVEPVTDNIFDWLTVIEHAVAVYTVDSVYMNLIEQIGFQLKKTAFLRSPAPFTPVLKHNWIYL